VILEAKRKILRRIDKEVTVESPVRTSMPQVHGTVHRFDKAAKAHDVTVVGTHRNKLSGLPRIVRKMVEDNNDSEKACRHESTVFPCETKGCVYEISLTCGSIYIGETGKCPNVRLDEHLSGKAKYSSMVEHRKSCGCEVNPGKSELLVRGCKWQSSRRIREALLMEERIQSICDGTVISNPTATPSVWERRIARGS